MSDPTAAATWSVRLTDRDLRILCGFFEARVMRIDHVAAFHFEGRIEAAAKRLQKLKAAGLLAERPRRRYEPSILHLTTPALRELKRRGLLQRYPRVFNLHKRHQVSPLTLRHELTVLDVRAAFFRATTGKPGVSIDPFLTWPRLCQFRPSPRTGGRVVTCRPDGFFTINEAAPATTPRNRPATLAHHFYLELDRGTETLATLSDKALCYRAHYAGGGFAAQHGASPADFRAHPFRVLVVLNSAERRNNAIEALLRQRAPILTQVWLATLEDVLRDPLGAVWVQPRDYRDALASTEHTVAVPTPVDGTYRRNVQRDPFVDRTVPRRQMIGA
ncbi:MAG: replication-relaxation family protein [Tepidisphaeraceae bacterium]